MYMATTSAYHPDPAASTPLVSSILFDANGHIGDHPANGTTVEEITSKKNQSIRVSIWPAAPPTPSRLFVHCPNLDPDLLCEGARIVCSADGLLLLRVGIVCRIASREDGDDYFVYKYQTGRPSLRRLPEPLIPFHDDEAGLLPRGGHFTIAVLFLSMEGYNLQLFKSETWNWTIISKVPVVTPQRPFPIKIPNNASRLNRHMQTTVITLGGKGGTMGWVDLWRGILFCDVLSSTPTLRGVPLPLPSRLINHHKGVQGCPKPNRGIAVVDGCLRMVELEVHGETLPTCDPETDLLNFRVDNWELFMYTNRLITGAWEDWQLDHRVEASNIDIDEAMHWKLKQLGLLHSRTLEGKEMKLHNLLPCQPALSLDDKGVVYLLTKVKFMQPKAWVLAVDVKGNKIQGLAEFGIDKSLGFSLAYCPSRITSYMDAWTTRGVCANSLEQLMALDEPVTADDGKSSAA